MALPSSCASSVGRRHRRQRGLSLVEMMVGIAIGLFVVAAASLVVSSQLNDNRRLLLELQVQQDLRATADIVTRELRRAGYWKAAQDAVSNPDLNLSATISNGNLALPISSGTQGTVDFKYKRTNDDEGPFGFKLTSDGVIRSKVTGQSGFQELTDINTLRVDEFDIALVASPAVRLPCPKDCPAGDDLCWPTVQVRDLTIRLVGHAPSDPSVKREVTTQVRLRNDNVVFNIAPAQACPV